MRRLRPLTEDECYARCYGGWEGTVRVVRAERTRRPTQAATVSGEALRAQLEARIDARDPDEAVEAA
jgi:hypothetical protein